MNKKNKILCPHFIRRTKGHREVGIKCKKYGHGLLTMKIGQSHLRPLDDNGINSREEWINEHCSNENFEDCNFYKNNTL